MCSKYRKNVFRLKITNEKILCDIFQLKNLTQQKFDYLLLEMGVGPIKCEDDF